MARVSPPVLLLTNFWKFLTAVAVPLPYLPSTALLLSRPTCSSSSCISVICALEEELLMVPLLSGVFMGMGVGVAVGFAVAVLMGLGVGVAACCSSHQST